MKENDWIVAGLTNPDINSGEFRALGLNIDNTQLLTKEEYLKSDFIKNNEAFKDSEGNFQESKFDEYYNNRLIEFKAFSDIEDGFQYDLFDYRRFNTPNSNVKNPKLTMIQVANPQEYTIGDGWINQINESPLSDRERAQKNKIYDSKTKQFLEYSPNEHSLTSNPIDWFKDLFKDTLVLATYDSEGTHINPITGLEEKHNKGDKKLDNNGKYYYETLNGRSAAGKTILSTFDVLTVDGEGLNSIDFMDSDSRDKSIGGTIMKSAAAIAPLFIGGPVGIAYSTALVARELAKALPMIDGLTSYALGNEDTPFTKLSNSLAGKAAQFTTSTSDYSMRNQLSFENIANLMSDVALQWGQQKLIAQSLQKLSGSDKLLDEAEKAAESTWKKIAPGLIEAEKAKGIPEDKILKSFGNLTNWKKSDLGQSLLQRELVPLQAKLNNINNLAADASLAYMAIVSNADTYQSMLEHGVTKKEAATVALASTFGMFAVDKYLGLGTVFFDELAHNNLRSIQSVLKKESSDWIKSMADGVKDASTKPTSKQLFSKAYKSYQKVYDKFWDDLHHHTLGALGKMVAEGMEEVNEELVMDLSKQIYELAAEFGPTDRFFGDLTTDNVGAFDDAFNNPYWFQQMMSRYGMNFLGGFLGGGIFYAKEKFDGKDFKRDTTEDTLIQNVRNFGANSVIKVLNDYKNQGKLGSTTKSFQYQITDSGERVFLDSKSEEDSQNNFVYKQLLNEIKGIEAIINDDERLMSDQDLMYNMTLGEARFQQLMSDNGVGGDYSKGLRDRYAKLSSDYVAVIKNINAIEASKPDQKSAESPKILEKLYARKSNLEKQLDEFLSGESAIDYMGQVLFQMDDRISDIFFTPNFKSWLKYKHDNKIDGYVIDPMTLQEFESLSETEQNKIVEKYLEYKNSDQYQLDADSAWGAFKDIRKQISPEFTDMQEKSAQFRTYLSKINDIFKPENNPFINIKKVSEKDVSEDSQDQDLRYTYDDTYEGESYLEYENRNNLTEEEREERISKIKKDKAEKANYKYQTEALEKVADLIRNSGGLLDESTKRHLMLQVGIRQSDVIKEQVEKLGFGNISTRNQEIINTYLDPKSPNGLKADLSNFSEMSSKIIDTLLEESGNSTIDAIVDHKLPIVQSLSFSLSKIWGLDPESNREDTILDIKLLVELFKRYHQRSQEILGALHNAKLDLFEEDELSRTKIFNFIEKVKKDTGITHAKLSSTDINTLSNYFQNEIGVSEEVLEDILKVFINKDKLLDADSLILNTQTLFETEEDLNNNKIKIRTIGKDPDIQYYKNIWDTISQSSGLISANDIKYMFTPDTSGYLQWDRVDETINYYDGINLLEVIDDYDMFDYVALSDNETYTGLLDQVKDFVSNKLSNLFDNVTSDPVYKYIQDLNTMTPIENPIINIVKKLGLSLSKDTKNVEDLLQKLMTGLESKGSSEFTLSPDERDSLDEAINLLKMAETFVYAALESKDIQNPFPHNKLINSIAKKNEIHIEEFATIDEDIANLYITQIRSLIKEIGEIEENGEYTIGSWRWWDARNAFNKSAQFAQSREANTNTKLTFFDYNRDCFRCADFDLLDGYDLIPETSDRSVKLFKIESLLHKNVKSLLKTRTLPEILNSLETIDWFTNKDECLDQVTSDLGSSIKYQDLTAMDKGIYLLSIIGIDPLKFHKFQKKFKDDHQNLAALDIQQQVSRVGLAMQESPKLFSGGLAWLYEKMKQPAHIPVLINGVFISGNGGAGKSEVVIRQQVEYGLQKHSPEEIILTGPTQDQQARLKELGVGKVMDYKEMIKSILGEDLHSKYEANDSSVISEHKINSDNSVKIFSGKLNKDNAKYKLIVIDEATHLSTKELSVFSEYSKQFNVPLILVGDNYQAGHLDIDGFPINLTPETAFLARSSRLSITLRDGNLQKWNNIQLLTRLLKQATTIPQNSERQRNIQNVLDQFKSTQLHYYLGRYLNGDMIVDSLSTDLLKSLDLKDIKGKIKRILYVGNNSDVVSSLKSIYGEENVVQKTELSQIQGAEFSNIIVDQDLGKIEGSGLESKLNSALAWLRKFYTLSTRGVNSAIFVDSSHNLRNIIQDSARDSYKNTTSNFSEQSIKNFSEELDKFYKEIIPESEPDQQSGETTEVQPESESTQPKQSRGHEPEEVPNIDTTVVTRFSRSSGNETFIDGNYIDINLQTSSLADSQRLKGMEAEDEAVPQDIPVDITKYSGEFDQVMIYGENTLTGMSFTEDDHKIRTYTAKNEDIVYDAEIFTEPNEIIVHNPGETPEAFQKLLTLKKAILYNIPDKYLGDSFNNLIFDKDDPETYNGIISLDDIKKIQSGESVKLEISVHNPEKDNFINTHRLGSTQLSEEASAMSIAQDNGKYLVFKLIAEFEIASGPRKGKKARLTIGMLANPSRFESKQDDIKKSLDKFINANEDREDQKDNVDRARRFKNDLETVIANYKEWVNSYVKKYQENNSTTFITDIGGELVFDRTTQIRTAVRNKDNTVPRLRLSTDSLPEAVKDVLSDEFTFEQVNPDVKVSNVYIFRSSRETFSDLSSISGSACVFVSRDPSLQSEKELLNRWAEEYSSSKKGQHSVRMLILDNVGCSVSQLVDTELRKMFKSNSGFDEESVNYKTLPYETHMMSIRQIVALWNFRANLLTFNKYLEQALLPNGIFGKLGFSSIDSFGTTITPVLQRLHQYYQKAAQESEKKGEVLSEQKFRNLYREDAANSSDLDYAESIWQFNDSLSNNCRQFRLGHGNKNPWQIRKLHLTEGNPFYTEEEIRNDVYGIYLTPEYMQSLITSVEAALRMLDTLGFSIRSSKKEGGRVVWMDKAHTEVIETEIRKGGKSKRSRSASGFVNTIWNSVISSKNQDLNVHPELRGQPAPIEVVSESEDTFILRTFATLLHTSAVRAAAYARTEEDNEGRYLPNTEKHKHNNLKIRWKPGYFKKSVYFTKKEDGKYIKDESKPAISVDMTKAINQGDAFVQMLELCFHGTTDEFIHKNLRATQNKVVKDENGNVVKKYKGKVTPQATDAYFKYGFFMDPNIKYRQRKNTDHLKQESVLNHFVECATSKAMFLVRAKIDLPRCYIRLKPEGTEQKEQGEVQDPTFIPIDLNAEYNNANFQGKEAFLNKPFKENPRSYDIFNKIQNAAKNSNLTFTEDDAKRLIWKVVYPNNEPFLQTTFETKDGTTYIITINKDNEVVVGSPENNAQATLIDIAKEHEQDINEIINTIEEYKKGEDEKKLDTFITFIDELNTETSIEDFNKNIQPIEDLLDIMPEEFINALDRIKRSLENNNKCSL